MEITHTCVERINETDRCNLNRETNWYDMVFANYIVLSEFFLESSSTTMRSAVFSLECNNSIYMCVRTHIFVKISNVFFVHSLLRQFKLNIAVFFNTLSIFSIYFYLAHTQTQKIGFLYSLLLLFSCFESIFILNTKNEHELMKMNWMWRWKVSVLQMPQWKSKYLLNT